MCASACSWRGVIGVVHETGDSDSDILDPGANSSGIDGLATGGATTDTPKPGALTSGAGSGASGGGSSASTSGGGDSGVSGGDPRPPVDLGDGSGLSVKGGGDLECPYTMPTPCDESDDALAAAIGLGCERGVEPTEFIVDGADSSRLVFEGALGGVDTPYTPRHGERFVILSTGDARHVSMSRADIEAETGCAADSALCPSTAHGPMYRYEVLPPPIDPNPVEGESSCAKELGLVGTGDCSRTILEQWQAGEGELFAHDYTELRFSAVVPDDATHIRFSYAFLSAEYPARIEDGHNDLFIAWIDSERWTGNVALDDEANPIAVDVVRFEYRDAEHPEQCSEGDCVEPKLHGFGFERHGATGWLERVAPVVVGDELTLVFSLFDLGDAEVDSAILLDGVRWDCALPG